MLVPTLALPRDGGGKPQAPRSRSTRRLVTDFNRINVELVGHYTRECEDPQHSSLWANGRCVEHLRLNVMPLKSGERPRRRCRSPSSTSAAPRAAFLRLRRRAVVDQLEVARHRLVVVQRARRLPRRGVPGVERRTARRPTPSCSPRPRPPSTASRCRPSPARRSAVVDHPQDATRKLLLVLGRNPGELRSAAAALTLNYAPPPATAVTIPSLQDIPARQALRRRAG